MTRHRDVIVIVDVKFCNLVLMTQMLNSFVSLINRIISMNQALSHKQLSIIRVVLVAHNIVHLVDMHEVNLAQSLLVLLFPQTKLRLVE